MLVVGLDGFIRGGTGNKLMRQRTFVFTVVVNFFVLLTE